MVATDSKYDYEYLVQEDKLHGWVYTKQDIFDEEMEKIFHNGWVYVGHASEIPTPGDYRLTWIGRQSVIMVRDLNGEVQLLANRCRHRGNSVCQTERGNANYFRCAYHGWTYRSTGDLVGVPFVDGYGGSLNKEELGLAKVPLVATYRGFIWGNLSPTGMPFDDFLGKPTRDQIDIVLDQSPLGEIEVRAGITKGKYFGNWKFVGMDGYHPGFVHQSGGAGYDPRPQADNAATPGPSGARFQRDLGQGHVRLGAGMANIDQIPHFSENLGSRINNRRGGPPAVKPAWIEEYRETMIKTYGEERAEFLLRERGNHMGLFPNMQLIARHIRVIRPISPGETEVFMYPFTLKGVPKELNTARIHGHEWNYGPASTINPDDYEMFERNQVGLSNETEPWLIISRGEHRQKQLEDGTILSDYSDEITQRAMIQRWKQQMMIDVSK